MLRSLQTLACQESSLQHDTRCVDEKNNENQNIMFTLIDLAHSDIIGMKRDSNIFGNEFAGREILAEIEINLGRTVCTSDSPFSR